MPTLTLIADRFVRDADGRVLDLATGEPVTLVETTLRTAAEQRARQERCQALIDASPRASQRGANQHETNQQSPLMDCALVDYALVDYALVGESQWIEAYREQPAGSGGSSGAAAPSTASSSQSSGQSSAECSALDGAVAALDGLRAVDVRRLYVKSARTSQFTAFVATVAREARARGYIPVSPIAVQQWPGVVSLLRLRSIILLGHRAADTRPHALARVLVTLTRAVASVVAIVVRVAERAAVAALRLPSVSIDRHSEHDRDYERRSLPLDARRSGSRAMTSIARVAEPVAASRSRGRIIGADFGRAYPMTPPAAPEQRGRIRHRPAPSSPWSRGSLAIPVMTADDEEIEESAMEGSDAECENLTLPIVTTTMSGYGAAADALVRRGRWAAACRELRSTLAAHDRRDATVDASRTALSLGRLFLAQSDLSNAARWLDHASERAARAGDPRLIAEVLRWSGVAALDRADLEQSERLLRTALAAAGPTADPQQLLSMDLTLARCLYWQGRFDEIALPGIDALPTVVPPRSPPDAIRDASADHRLREVGECASRRRRTTGRSLRTAETEGSRVTETGLLAAETGGSTAAKVGMAAGDIGVSPTKSGTAAAEIEVAAADIRMAAAGIHTVAAANGAAAAEVQRAVEAVILRVSYWRLVARLAMVRGDLSRAGDALARACRLARGDDEDDVRSGACHLDPTFASTGNAWRGGVGAPGFSPERGGRDNRARAGLRWSHALDGVDADLRVACHLDAARLQLAIGDWAGCDLHLRECLALPRAAARTRRIQVLQLARRRGDRRIEARRQVERLSAALRQAHVPPLIRIRVRYLVEPRSRRAGELTTFLARHGEAPLSGRSANQADKGNDPRDRDLRGGSPMLDAFQAVLQICHETPDDLAALGRVCTFLRDRVQAAHVSIYGTPLDRGRLAFAGSSRLTSSELAARVIDTGLMMPPTYRPDALDAAAPIRYQNQTIGALVARWIVDATIDQTSASALLSAAAAALAPQVRAALDRHPPDDATTSADASSTSSSSSSSSSSSTARTLGLLGVSTAIVTLRQTIGRVASAPFHVLIQGESGSGKELVARAIHHHGPRRHRRFCAINCAALTDELLEAELFGHTRGAFTGALTERVGLFEEADHGTLFLDEIGELSARGQAKLLRVIQDGETRRIGENLPRRVDARIVAATNRALRDEAAAGQFRADLLYRLDVIRIVVPPLRTRPEDVPILARAFWTDATSRTGSRATLDPDTLAALARYHWPGNVRELQNAIMALAVHAPARGRVPPSLLPPTIRGHPRGADGGDRPASDGSDTADDRGVDASEVDASSPDASYPVTLDAARREFESRFVLAALTRTGGHTTRAAQELGLTREGLRRLMLRLGLHTATGRSDAAAPEPERASPDSS